MTRRLLVFISLLLQILPISGQKVIISGYIHDASSGERMIGAAIFEKVSLTGTNSNNYGFYSLQLVPGSSEIIVSYLGYKQTSIKVDLSRDTIIDFNMEQSVKELDAVTITANGLQSRIESSQMSMIDIPIDKFMKLPVLFGEADILKVIQLIPGVQSGTEGSMGLYVRGGGPDQNLFLIDGVPVYNASHLFGFMSVFNPDAVKSVQLFKGGFPARYGERLSSVVDIRMKEGNEKEFHGDISVGLISSKISLEGPVKKDRTSFIISARRTYADMFVRPIVALTNDDPDYISTGGYYFYDLNAKLNHKFSEKSCLYLSSYIGKDKAFYKEESTPDYYDAKGYKYEYNDKFGLGWGNIITSLRWNYLFNNKLFSNTTLTISNYRFDITSESVTKNLTINKKSVDLFKYFSGIMDFGAKIDFEYFPTSRHSIKFGTGYTYHFFKPGVTAYRYNSIDNNKGIDTTFGDIKVYANELIAYVEDDFGISQRIKLNIGVRLSHFNVQDTNYLSLQPRASLRFMATDNLSFKVSYSKMVQFVHLLTTSAISLPTDLWLPVTRKFGPPVSHQVALGTSFHLPWKLDMTIEGFYKTMDNIIEYKEGASFSGTGSGWESKVEKGKGWAYGTEFFIEKNIGKTTGWIGYTLSKTDRQFENLNFGKVFPAKYDRRHDVSIALSYKFNERMDLGFVWVYGTGNAATLGIMEYPMLNSIIPDYFYFTPVTEFPERNNYRTPSYHRLDLSFSLQKDKKHGTRIWNFSIYNAYCRKNPFFIFWDEDYIMDKDPLTGKLTLYHAPVLKKVSLFPIIPSVSYSFKF